MKDEKEKVAVLDPTPDSNPDPITGAPGSHPVGVAGGGVAGAGAGAAVGGLIGGPIGAAVGGVIGAVAGAAVGKGAAEAVDPTVEDAYWQSNYTGRPYAKGREYSYHQSAYRYGWESASKYPGKSFEEVEPTLQKEWHKVRGTASAEWQDVRDAVRDSYERIRSRS